MVHVLLGGTSAGLITVLHFLHRIFDFDFVFLGGNYFSPINLSNLMKESPFF